MPIRACPSELTRLGVRTIGTDRVRPFGSAGGEGSGSDTAGLMGGAGKAAPK